MDTFTTVTGVAAPLPMINVDTDRIIPKTYLRRSDAPASAGICSPSSATVATAARTRTSCSTGRPTAGRRS